MSPSTAEPRQRSLWGWGYADRFPPAAARRQVGAMVSAATGIGPLEPQEPAPEASIALAPPRVAVPAELTDFTSVSRAARLSHTHGRGYRDLVRGFRGDYAPAPDLVLTPRTEDEVAAALAWASRAGVAVIPWGGGTSVTGGVEARVGPGYQAVATLDLAALCEVATPCAVSGTVRIGAGATGPVIEHALGAHGMTLRHFPQSFEFSTLGGWVATRAGGHFATVYTHIDDLVAAVRMVTPAGTFATWPLPGSGAGPSPDRMVLGSEGILGVITEATVRVRQRPDRRASASVRFESFEDGVQAARAIARSGLFPSNCRLLDRTEATLNRVPAGGRHVLLLGFEGVGRALGPPMDEALALARAAGGTCDEGPRFRDDDAAARARGDGGAARESAAWRAAFLDAPYLQTILVSLGVLVDTFETACSWQAFPALDAALHARVGEALRRVAGGGVLTRRFTHVYPDGPAPYYTFIAKAPPGGELDAWQAVKDAASETLGEHGATITHHHAVGRTHRPWYDRQRPELFARALASAKRELDPAWVLNPGVLIDRPE
ncbi:MAG: FAD-binding oxidoreductase [Deltaproteobacteria bacterium]|nr:FAD-binding oxidoreductase [Deltaproteobacteria bacterium]MCB9789069.1 FAD-binding oxidoreductase [Deltaproteobacteria bacterium]